MSPTEPGELPGEIYQGAVSAVSLICAISHPVEVRWARDDAVKIFRRVRKAYCNTT